MKVKLVSKKDYRELERLRKEFEISDDGELCLAVGGDGTFLRVAGSYDGPILPVRTDKDGTLGYFSDVSLGDIDLIVKKLKSKEYVIEPLGRKMEIEFKGRRYYAVNEVSLNNVSKAVHFRIFRTVGGKKEPLLPFIITGDGVLTTGNIGSTAYNRSAGGPILLSPDVTCTTILSADTPIKNPIVMDGKEELDVEVVKGRGVLRNDSKDISALDSGESFHVKYSEQVVSVVRFPGKREGFAEKLERAVRARMAKKVDM